MKIFLDANLLLDVFDDSRRYSEISEELYRSLIIDESVELFTSCDIITTIYYVNSKIDKTATLNNIRAINKTLKVVEFSNKEIEETCSLMVEDTDYKDLEDAIQYVLAKKNRCDLIISNDESFVSKDIKLMSSEELYNEFNR